jgi:hypothetical protein
MEALKLTRSLSSIERESIGKAMKAVKDQGHSYTSRGLSPFSFYFGVVNVFITGFYLGRAPEYYWIFQIFKCWFYLGAIWMIRLREKKDILSMIEFCWVAAYIYMAYLTVAALAAMELVEAKWMAEYSSKAFIMYWGVANGPLASAAIVLNNALIFHDIPNLASCFIHLTPCSAVWSMRWYAPRLNRIWPDVF